MENPIPFHLQSARRWAALFALMSVVSACGGVVSDRSGAASSTCSGDERYLPRGTFPKAYPGTDQKRRAWYSLALARLGEPSLSCDEGTAETYRLIWLSSLAQPVVIRIAHAGQSVSLDAFQLSGSGWRDPGVLSYNVHKELSDADWRELQNALKRARFWSLETSGNLYGAHGEQWIIEGRRAGSVVSATYHVTDRWSPPAGAYRDLGVLFFDLAGWQRPYSSFR